MLFLHESVFAPGLSIMAITEIHHEAKFYKSENSIIGFFPSKQMYYHLTSIKDSAMLYKLR